jgi:hypothetical protein
MGRPVSAWWLAVSAASVLALTVFLAAARRGSATDQED